MQMTQIRSQSRTLRYYTAIIGMRAYHVKGYPVTDRRHHSLADSRSRIQAVVSILSLLVNRFNCLASFQKAASTWPGV